MSAIKPGLRRARLPLVALSLLLPLIAGCQSGGSPGERLYRRHCDTCHGVDGGGGIQYLADEGADLLDGVWKHGGDPTSIERTLIEDRVTEHPTWDFTHQEFKQLTDYVLALRNEHR